MIKLSPSSGFLKRLKKLSQQQQKKIADSLHQFITTPDHPALRFKQLIVNKPADYYSIRASLDCRIILKLVTEDHYALIDVGDHQVYDRLRR